MLDNKTEIEETSTPEITFHFDQKRDESKIISMLSRPNPIRGGSNFPEFIYKCHPGLRTRVTTTGNITTAVEEYVDEYYQIHKMEATNQLHQIETDWKLVEQPYLEAVDNIFDGSLWPYQTFRGIYTITYPCQRDLSTGRFQVGYDLSGYHKTAVAHELHHFRFYEYLRQRYCPSVELLDEREIAKILQPSFIIPVWELSETLVKVHFEDQPFSSLFPRTQGYPGLADEYDQVRKYWQESGRNLSYFMQLIEN